MQHSGIVLLPSFHVAGNRGSEAVANDLFTNCKGNEVSLGAKFHSQRSCSTKLHVSVCTYTVFSVCKCSRELSQHNHNHDQHVHPILYLYNLAKYVSKTVSGYIKNKNLLPIRS